MTERRDQIHSRMEEYRDALKYKSEKDYSLNPNTKGVVILSGNPDIIVKEDGTKEEVHKSGENLARIGFGVRLLLKKQAEATGKPLEELKPADLVDAKMPPLVLNGETVQLPAMREIAQELGYPPNRIIEVNSGERGVSNTKTQFEAMNADLQFADWDHVTFITSGYHQPRVARTANAQLRPEMQYDVFPADYMVGTPFRTVLGEMRRLDRYIPTGDIAPLPTRPTAEPEVGPSS